MPLVLECVGGARAWKTLIQQAQQREYDKHIWVRGFSKHETQSCLEGFHPCFPKFLKPLTPNMLHVCVGPRARNPSMSIASISVLQVMKPCKLTANGHSTPFFHRFVVYADSTYFCSVCTHLRRAAHVLVCKSLRMVTFFFRHWSSNSCPTSWKWRVQTLDPIRFCGQFVANANILAQHYCTWTTGAVTLLRKAGACLSW